MKFSVARWPTPRYMIDQDFVRATNQSMYDDFIDTSLPQWTFLLSGPLAGGRPPPVDAIPRDTATRNLMVAWYGPQRVANVVP